MIDEEATFEQFGHYSTELSPKSNKKIIAVCDGCGKVRISSKSHYHARCNACARKGELHPNWQGGKVMRICEECRIEFPVYPSFVKLGWGKFCSCKCKEKWHSKHLRGKNSPNWKNGASFEPYCSKWNEPFREYIRDKFGRVCFLCPKTEEENGQLLSVHHVNGNKNCGCDDDETCQFVPLCVSCHSKVHSKKIDWEAKIRAKMKNKLNGWCV